MTGSDGKFVLFARVKVPRGHPLVAELVLALMGVAKARSDSDTGGVASLSEHTVMVTAARGARFASRAAIKTPAAANSFAEASSAAPEEAVVIVTSKAVGYAPRVGSAAVLHGATIAQLSPIRPHVQALEITKATALSLAASGSLEKPKAT